MAGNNSRWQGDNKGNGASVEEDSTPKFSGDDMEFESFMFDSGELSAHSQAASVATATAPVSATLDAVPPMAGGVMPTSGPLPVEQPAMEQDNSFDGAGMSEARADMPAFSLDASGPVDTAPVDPTDLFVPPAPQQAAGDIAGEDVPLPFHLQTSESEPEIPPFVPEVPIQPLPVRSRTTGALEAIPTGPLDQISPSTTVPKGNPDHRPLTTDSSSLQASDAQADDGWTDASLSVIEDFSSVLLAMQAGSHFPLTIGGAATLDEQPSGMVEEAVAHYEVTSESTQTVYSDEAPAQQEPLQELSDQSEPQMMQEPVEARVPTVDMLDDGAVMQTDPHKQSDVAAPQAEMQQDVAQSADQVPVAGVTFALPDEPAEIEEGQFKGADFEFESFMFTSPPPASPEVMPAPAVDAQPATKDSPPESTSTLPFWLQTSELPDLPDQPIMDASQGDASPVEAAMLEMEAEAADLVMESAPTLESAQQDVYDDLPPIDPFDFSLLQPVEEEERLGFNLQELEGMIPMDRMSTNVTTDLNALAEFLGTKSPPDVAKDQTWDDAAVEEGVAVAEVLAQEAPSEVVAQVEARPSSSKGKGKGTTGLPPQAEGDATSAGGSPSWTSTVTSNLSTEARAQVEQAAEPEARQVGEAPEPPSDVEADMAPMTASMTARDLSPDAAVIEIDPFNYTELDLEDDEASTEQLSNMATNTITSTGVLDIGEQPATPALRSQLSPGGDLAPGIPLDTGSFDDENDTSFFSSAQPTRKVGAKSTGWLSDSETQAVGEQPAAVPGPKAKSKTGGVAGGSKARVARGATKERKQLDTAIVDSSSHEKPDEPLPTEASAVQQDSDSTSGYQARSYVSSGPLPAMAGFEALHEIADRNPDDLSTQIALASAYAQSGEYDAALRTYRRALKKPTISPAMLEVIAEEISDIEEEAAHLPRFHQVLGDLYMKQGRYKDAIDEYNRIG